MVHSLGAYCVRGLTEASWQSGACPHFISEETEAPASRKGTQLHHHSMADSSRRGVSLGSPSCLLCRPPWPPGGTATPRKLAGSAAFPEAGGPQTSEPASAWEGTLALVREAPKIDSQTHHYPPESSALRLGFRNLVFKFF